MRQAGLFGVFKNYDDKPIGGFTKWVITADIETKPKKGWMTCQVKNWQASIQKWWMNEKCDGIIGEFFTVVKEKPVLLVKVKLAIDKGSISQLGKMMDSTLIAKKEV